MQTNIILDKELLLERVNQRAYHDQNPHMESTISLTRLKEVLDELAQEVDDEPIGEYKTYTGNGLFTAPFNHMQYNPNHVFKIGDKVYKQSQPRTIPLDFHLSLLQNERVFVHKKSGNIKRFLSAKTIKEMNRLEKQYDSFIMMPDFSNNSIDHLLDLPIQGGWRNHYPDWPYDVDVSTGLKVLLQTDQAVTATPYWDLDGKDIQGFVNISTGEHYALHDVKGWLYMAEYEKIINNEVDVVTDLPVHKPNPFPNLNNYLEEFIKARIANPVTWNKPELIPVSNFVIKIKLINDDITDGIFSKGEFYRVYIEDDVRIDSEVPITFDVEGWLSVEEFTALNILKFDQNYLKSEAMFHAEKAGMVYGDELLKEIANSVLVVNPELVKVLNQAILGLDVAYDFLLQFVKPEDLKSNVPLKEINKAVEILKPYRKDEDNHVGRT